MSDVENNSRKVIGSICASLLFLTLNARAAGFSPAPDNAALLYYQAFVLRPEPDSDTYRLLDEVLRGADPTAKVREYLDLEAIRETIRIAEAATKIPNCSWGIMRSHGVYNLMLKTVLGQLRQLAFLLEVNARTLAADGDYRAALERSLGIRRLAQHITDESVPGYLLSMPLHGRGLGCIQHVLGYMSPDADTLTWLQGQLSTVQGAPPLPGKAMEIQLDDTLEFLNMHPEILATWRQNVCELIEDENARQKVMSLSNEELLKRARESYTRFLASVNRVMGSNIPYQQKYGELQRLMQELDDHAIDDPVGILSWYMLDDVARFHDIYIRGMANYNALRTAIEIYLIKAETGQLPEVLTVHLPGDPFSGQDFEYETTSHGFVLRCRQKEIGEDMTWQYEFVISN